ncbi:MAG: PAS domain S-box protein [Pyrinomonadaceae bacterium]|nr:PAS domain S-box protein [Pyrinomonadaceae bacterium]
MHDDNKNSVKLNSGAAEQMETRLNLLYEIGRILASTETMNEAAPQILETICRNLKFDIGELWSLREGEAVLRRTGVWHLPSQTLEKIAADSRQFEFPVGMGLPGKVWRQNAPVWIENLSGENNNMPCRIFADQAGLHSAFAFPVLLGEKFLGAFSFFCENQCPHDEALLQMFSAVGGNIGQFIKRERVEKHLRESEERFSKAFDASPLALTISSLETGKLIEVNETFVNVSGFSREETIGRTTAELGIWANPPEREKELEILRRSGHLRNAEYRFRMKSGAEIVGLLSAERIEIGGESFALTVIQDITDSKLSENRLALLAELSDLNRKFEDPNELLFAVARAVGEHLQVRRCLFNEIDLTNDRETVHRDYCRGVESVAGVHRISDYSSITFAEMTAGKTVVNHDSKIDSRTASDYEKTYAPVGERAYVTVPLLRETQWVASLWVSTDEPREWSGQEISLLETVAERTWTAIEKLRIDAALRRSEINALLLAEISLDLARLTGIDEIMRVVGEKISRHLDVSRVYFSEINEAAETITVIYDWCKRDVPSAVGIYGLADYISDEFQKELKAGQVIAVGDVKTDSRTTANAGVLQILDIGSYLNAPFISDGRWKFLLAVQHRQPYEWRADEIELLRDLAARIWTSIERRRAEEALRESESRYRTLFESIDEGFCVIEMIFDDNEKPVDYRHIEMNPAFEQHTGFERALGKTIREIVPNLEEFWFETYGRVALTGKAVRLEHYVEAMNRWFDIYASRVGDDTSRKVAVVFNNITERRRAEESLRESQNVLSLAMSSSRMGAWSRDLTNEAVYWSAELEELFGLAPGTFAGNINGFYNYVYAGDKERLAREVQNALSERRDYIIEFRFHHADGSLRWMEGRGQGIYAPDGKPVKVYGIGIDITERKRAEAERERLLESERQAREIAEQANHAKDEFIALVSHELRSPLNAMLGWARILQNQKPDAKITENALDVIVKNARSQSRLIEDLLDIARVGKGKLRVELVPIELVPIIKAALEVIKPAANAKNINLDETLDRAANFINGDGDRLRQVVENLLANAVKFTPDGGSVQIRLERDGRNAKITISDTGQGISADFLPQIFERFKQADPSATRRHGGLGIGLSLARDLVELHGGTISAQSAGEDKGTAITTTLPLRMILPIKEITGRIENMDSHGKLSGFWILAVDDEADAREIISFMLQINGAQVTSANSAVEALEILKTANGRLPDILLSDISMPNESGYALLEKIRSLPREHGGQIPAVALTAFNRPEDREAAFEAGFQKHLGKPVDMDALIDAIVETAGAK